MNLRARVGDSPDALRTYREWEGQAVDATDEHKVPWIERGRFHRDENILRQEPIRNRVEFDAI